MSEYRLYRHFGQDDVLLYVGIAANALGRQGQHKDKSWAPFVTRIEIATYPSKLLARKAESWAIATEAPLFNKQQATGLPSNAQVGQDLQFTLAEAYKMAAQGERLHTIDPVEFAGMPRSERRRHQSALTRIARTARRSETAFTQ